MWEDDDIDDIWMDEEEAIDESEIIYLPPSNSLKLSLLEAYTKTQYFNYVDTRINIIFKHNFYNIRRYDNSPPNPFENFSFFEIKEYTVTIIDAPTYFEEILKLFPEPNKSIDLTSLINNIIKECRKYIYEYHYYSCSSLIKRKISAKAKLISSENYRKKHQDMLSQIQALKQSGKTMQQIAKKLNISRKTAYNIINEQKPKP